MCEKHTSPQPKQGLPSVQRSPGAVALVLSVPSQASFPSWCPVCSAEPRQVLRKCDVMVLPSLVSIGILAVGGKSHWCYCQQALSLPHIIPGCSPGSGLKSSPPLQTCPGCYLCSQRTGCRGCREKLPTQPAALIYFCREKNLTS